MSSTDDKVLKPGSFYWVMPVLDVDFTPPGFDYSDDSEAARNAAFDHWTQQNQPARFEGYTETGEEKWIYLGHDDEGKWWPARWVGDEVVMK